MVVMVTLTEHKRNANDWTETLIVREDTTEYGTDSAITHDLRILLDGVVE